MTLAAITFSQPAQAILDTNANLLSDLWEKQHNNGNLFAPIILATNDEDQDGWTNAQEAAAGTDPLDTNPPDGIVTVTITPSLTAGAFTLTWPTLVGKNYQLKVSTDLLTWTNLGDPITTTQTTHSIGINTIQPDTTIPPKVFWQVVVTDLDSDLDGLTNSEENALGTNPNLADSDGDTLNDKAEILANTNPLDEDTDEDGLADNLDATPLANDALADPDGTNLATHLNNYTTATNGVRLIARYDFEALPVGANNDFPSSIPTVPAAVALNVGLDRFANPSGMPSFCCQWNAAPTANEYLSLPHQILNERSQYTWSYWLKLPKDAFVASAQNTGIRSLLSIGINRFAPSVLGTSSPLPALHWYCDIATGKIRAETYQIQIGTPAMLGSGWDIPAAWNDGEWHHIVLHKNDTNYKIYFDGADLGNRPSNNIDVPLSTNSYTLIGRRDLTTTTQTNTAYRFPPGSRLDRLRCYTALTQADVTALCNHDIDRDGLHDRTESRLRYWNDRNQNTLREATESDYILRPFHHDAIGTDHDKDGIPSHDEQNGPVTSHPGKFDTDGDLLPDGWEKLHNLPYNNPAAPPNTHTDIDNDGATNYQEYLAASNPHDPDTDDDGTNDGPEINQHSNATDPSDQGQAPDPAHTYSLNLAVGDQSGSQSEHYQLNVYQYDWVNRTETKVTTLSADTYGGFKQAQLSGLDPLSTYTFQIQWIATNLGYNAQADFDYTFRVESTDPNSLTSVSEVFDPKTGTFETGSILGTKSNVTGFLITTEPKRAIVQPLRTDFAVDTDMDRIIESLHLKFGASNQFGPDSSKQDRDLLESDPQRAVIIDVNNNNSDSKTPSAGSAVVDNANNTLDGGVDKTEITANPEGHSFGNIRLWCWPNENFGIPWFGKPAKYQLKLSYADAAHANYVRIFAATGVTNDNQKPIMYLGPGKTEHFIDPVEFFTETPFKDPTATNAYRNLVAEGITYGTATIKLEIVDIATNTAVGQPQIVRITTNVDRIEQKPADVAANKDALHMRGVAPHHFGVRKPGQSTAGIRAIKGKLTIRLPSTNTGNNARLTPMDGRRLKQQTNNQTDSGASFWIGLTQYSASGAPEQWVQTGVRWLQPSIEKDYASPPALYLELGDTYKALGAKALSQASTNHSDRTWLGDGVTGAANSILSGWHNSSIELDFILFKPIGPKDENGNDEHVENWNVIFKDQNGNYLRLDRSNPNPPANVTVPNTDQDELAKRYKKQQFKHIDCLFETNNSITLTVGTTNSQGSFSNLQHAGVYIAEAAAMPTSGTAAQLFAWAESNFAWSDTSFNSSASEVKTGKWSIDSAGNTNHAESGVHEHPYWRKSVTPTSLHVWDLRNYGYNTAQ